MIKGKTIFLATFIICLVHVSALAVPTVRQFGTGGAISSGNAEKPVGALPSLPKPTSEVVRAVKIQPEKDVNDPARISAIGSIKTISSSRIKQPVASAEAQMVAAGVSETKFNALSDRVERLEQDTENALVGVTESGTGNYVSGVSVDNNNKLNVEKTRLLYAPVRNAGSNTIVSDAEIWLVR